MLLQKPADGTSLQGKQGEAGIKLDADGDGVDDLVPIGNINPDFTTSLNTWIEYKGLRLYMLWQWNKGGDVYNQTNQWIYRDNRHADFDQNGKAADDKKVATYYQTFYDVNSTNDYFVEKGSYLKLRELSLYYDLKSDLLKSIGIKFVEKITFGIVGRNLLTISDYSGYDPEVATPDADFDQTNYKFDGFGYPNFRTITASLDIHF